MKALTSLIVFTDSKFNLKILQKAKKCFHKTKNIFHLARFEIYFSKWRIKKIFIM